MKLRDYLTEKYEASFTASRERYTEIFKNPTRKEFDEALKSTENQPKFVRGFYDGKNIFVWRGDVLHSEVWAATTVTDSSSLTFDVLPKNRLLYVNSTNRWEVTLKEVKAIKKTLPWSIKTVYIDQIEEKEWIKMGK